MNRIIFFRFSRSFYLEESQLVFVARNQFENHPNYLSKSGETIRLSAIFRIRLFDKSSEVNDCMSRNISSGISFKKLCDKSRI